MITLSIDGQTVAGITAEITGHRQVGAMPRSCPATPGRFHASGSWQKACCP